jgi:dTDP-4-dehydrorhamnose reductase
MRVLVTGASGQLGGYLLRELIGQGIDVVAWSGSRAGEFGGVPLRPVDLADADGVAATFREARPSIVFHAAAIASVAECFRDQARATRVNARGTAVLAELAAEARARLLFVSTDLVFDGEKGWYKETDTPSPLSVYGRTKVDAERAVQSVASSVIVRMSLMYGPTLVDRPSFFDQQVAAFRDRRPITLFDDEWRTPLDFPTAARALVAIGRGDCVGMIHVGGPERLSRLEMGQRLAIHMRADSSLIVPAQRNLTGLAERRPRDTSLDSSCWRERFPVQPRPVFDEAVAKFIDEFEGKL